MSFWLGSLFLGVLSACLPLGVQSRAECEARGSRSSQSYLDSCAFYLSFDLEITVEEFINIGVISMLLTSAAGGGGVVAQLCLTLCNPVDCGPPGSSVCGSLQQECWSG